MKIAIVNDLESSIYRLRFIIEREPGWEVVWQAKNGIEAIEQCARQIPDLILMDLLMPVMNGAEATRIIMKRTPCAILVVTAGVDKNASLVFEALGNGAVDAVDMPDNSSENIELFKRKVNSIAKLITSSVMDKEKKTSSAKAITNDNNDENTLLAIGSSTGGPSVLSTILGQLPADFPAAIVIIQHIDEEYAAGLADWLNTQSRLQVDIAKEGDIPQSGHVLIAKTNDHLVLTKDGSLGYTTLPEESVYRPSVDEFFASAALYWQGDIIATLLTGMGRDGAKGLLALRRLGYYTLAQDEASSTVYGMPHAAVALNAAIENQPPEQIVKLIMDKVELIAKEGICRRLSI